MISPGNLQILKQRDLLDAQGHPTTEAYDIAIQTVSSDNSPLCQQLWEHANECEVCSQRADEALKRNKLSIIKQDKS